jgi:hypothetical protein
MLSLARAHDQSRNQFSTMTWFNITAEVSGGFCREAARDHSPGLQPWVRQIETRALKASPARCAGAIRRRRNTPILQYSNTPPARNRGRGRRRGRVRSASRVAPDVCAIGGINPPFPERTRRSPLSGRFNVSPNPGLKPWAVLSGPFHGQELPGAVNITNHCNA